MTDHRKYPRGLRETDIKLGALVWASHEPVRGSEDFLPGDFEKPVLARVEGAQFFVKEFERNRSHPNHKLSGRDYIVLARYSAGTRGEEKLTFVANGETGDWERTYRESVMVHEDLATNEYWNLEVRLPATNPGAGDLDWDRRYYIGFLSGLSASREATTRDTKEALSDALKWIEGSHDMFSEHYFDRRNL